MQTMKQKLQAARRLIAKGWCRGASAKDKAGQPTGFSSSGAVRYCAVGACWSVGVPLQLLLNQNIGPSVAYWNDSKKNKRDILRVFDKAIAACP